MVMNKYSYERIYRARITGHYTPNNYPTGKEQNCVEWMHETVGINFKAIYHKKYLYMYSLYPPYSRGGLLGATRPPPPQYI